MPSASPLLAPFSLLILLYDTHVRRVAAAPRQRPKPVPGLRWVGRTLQTALEQTAALLLLLLLLLRPQLSISSVQAVQGVACSRRGTIDRSSEPMTGGPGLCASRACWALRGERVEACQSRGPSAIEQRVWRVKVKNRRALGRGSLHAKGARLATHAHSPVSPCVASRHVRW